MPVQIKSYRDYYEPPEAIYTCDSCGCVVDEDDLPDGLGEDMIYCQDCWEDIREIEADEEETTE